jgi:DNA-directed RNA polymerase delta subunit
MIFIRSEKTGSVYTLDPNTLTELYYTPMMKDGEFATCFNDNDWTAVDWLSVLGEEEWVQPYLKDIHNQLLQEVTQ